MMSCSTCHFERYRSLVIIIRATRIVISAATIVILISISLLLSTNVVVAFVWKNNNRQRIIGYITATATIQQQQLLLRRRPAIILHSHHYPTTRFDHYFSYCIPSYSRSSIEKTDYHTKRQSYYIDNKSKYQKYSNKLLVLSSSQQQSSLPTQLNMTDNNSNNITSTDHDDDNNATTSYSVDERIKQLGIILPPAPKAAANYIPIQKCDNILYLSGHLPFHEDGQTLYTGKIGATIDNNVQYGYMAARQCGLNLIASLQHYLKDSSLQDVVQIIKIFGIVQSHDTFYEQHKVLNGCSDLMVEIFGTSIGVHARSAIGTNTLPLNISVEVEMIVQIKEMNKTSSK